MLGAPAVGKSSLVSQFMTSEYLHAYDTSIDDESGEKTVSVLLAGEESELTFIDHSCAEMTLIIDTEDGKAAKKESTSNAPKFLLKKIA
ncbi:gtp-binding protein rad [Lasius niger]|uniref:Gtp-binding protein rad n=1 Tax=Lasius niger TaxID=67767 RepID=A0A0J7KVT3_LASNI|nr:gtp-binding protein rad [Lasius niger]